MAYAKLPGSHECVERSYRGHGRGALALRENDLNETLQRFKEQKLVEAVSGDGTEQLYVTEEGKKALRK